jgi:hypothetical protein
MTAMIIPTSRPGQANLQRSISTQRERSLEACVTQTGQSRAVPIRVVGLGYNFHISMPCARPRLLAGTSWNYWRWSMLIQGHGTDTDTD